MFLFRHRITMGIEHMTAEAAKNLILDSSSDLLKEGIP